jgi:hypothetical protein
VIKQVKPKYLYVSADGHRIDKLGEKELCEQTRNIILNGIDWDCELKTLFRNENLGCGKAVSGGITWFFDIVEQGIILEDDCLPDPSFFTYCEELLDKYKHQENVMMISGNNFLFEKSSSIESYYFSNIPHIWGWASWKRAWAKYDFDMKDWKNKREEIIANKFKTREQENHLKKNINAVFNKKINTWDYQWVYSILRYNGCSIAPNINLIKNIGFEGTSGTHTNMEAPSWVKLLSTNYIGNLKHPTSITVNKDNDYEDYVRTSKTTILDKINIKIKGFAKKYL